MIEQGGVSGFAYTSEAQLTLPHANIRLARVTGKEMSFENAVGYIWKVGKRKFKKIIFMAEKP